MGIAITLRRRLRTWLDHTGHVVFWGVIGLTLLLSAEIAARFDDRLYQGIPFMANLDADRELRMSDEQGIRGRPYGKFKKWKLNNFGFRSPDIHLDPPEHCTRVLILGASETFGYYESPDMEYPAQLQRRLAESGCYEVINAAIAGMELAAMRRFWEHWASRFRPSVVLVYPTPHFYLHENVTRRAIGQPTPASASATPRVGFEFSSRFVLRLHDVFHYPYFIQKLRNERNIARQVEGKDASWYFHTVPEDRVHIFSAEMNMLVTSIQKSGATPVLMTHAFRASVPIRQEDYRDLEAIRVHMPRAFPEAIVLFESAANEEIREIASKRRLVVIDLARELGGRRECFADLIHFTDYGAGLVANVIARQIQAISLASGK